MKTNMNLRQEIITLIRGYFLTPVIANLAKTNFFKNKKFLKVNNHSEKILVNYLKNLGFIKESKNKFIISKKGKKIFSRSGSLEVSKGLKILIVARDNPKILNKINCDRKENVLGSGSTNYRKFFKPALGLLKKNDFDVIHDLGCGNGNFLKNINLTENKHFIVRALAFVKDLNKKKLKFKKCKINSIDFFLTLDLVKKIILI